MEFSFIYIMASLCREPICIYYSRVTCLQMETLGDLTNTHKPISTAEKETLKYTYISLLIYLETVLLCNPSWPGTLNLPASTFQVLK